MYKRGLRNKTVTSNSTAEGKTVSIKLKRSFEMVAERQPFTYGSSYRESTSNFRPLI